jgi:hypothetical protein
MGVRWKRQGLSVLEFGRTGVSDTKGCPLSGLGSDLETARLETCTYRVTR